MQVEESLANRAAVHAALGEPVRLAIAEALALSDAAPSELGEWLDLPSNLLAHHLDVLDSAGIVQRRRSDADRRRSYVRLAARAYPWVEPRLARKAHRVVPRVVFVCARNSARSPLAAALWVGRSSVPVASAGTEPATAVDPRAQAVARHHHLDLRGMRTAHVADILRPDDLVVTVCDRAHEQLGRSGRVRLHWSMPDPAYGDGADAFDRTFGALRERVGRLAAVAGSDPRAGGPP